MTRSALFSVFFLTLALIQSPPPLGAISSEATISNQPPDESELDLQTERVIVFKDGYSLIVKRGSAVTDANGEIYTAEVPSSAVLSSFWATPKQGRMISMVAGWTETTENDPREVLCSKMIEVIKANLGRTCSLQLKDKTTLTGKISEVLIQENQTAVPDFLRSTLALDSKSRTSSTYAKPDPSTHLSELVSTIHGTHFVLRTDHGDDLVAANDIARVTISEMKTKLTRTITTTRRTKRLRFLFEKPGERRELLILYFCPGIRWIPTYRIHLAKSGEEEEIASVAMQAEVLNEAEDLEGTNLDLVVGVPNFRFRSSISPLVLESTLRKTLEQAAPTLMNQFSNNSISNANFYHRSEDLPGSGRPLNRESNPVDLPEELTAGRAQDLFVYNLPPLHLKKGERCAIPIFQTEVPYRDVYTWDLHIKRNDIATAPSGSSKDGNSPQALTKNEVWRQVQLVNNTNLPWTTGAAMILIGQQPLAQELLTYTSAGDSCRIPVTISVDTRGQFSEAEIGRDLAALRWDGHTYAKIKQEARLILANRKSTPIDVEIKLRFGGKTDAISDDGVPKLDAYRAEDWQRFRGDPAVNNSTVVRWRSIVAPGAIFRPTVEYHYYTRQ